MKKTKDAKTYTSKHPSKPMNKDEFKNYIKAKAGKQYKKLGE